MKNEKQFLKNIFSQAVAEYSENSELLENLLVITPQDVVFCKSGAKTNLENNAKKQGVETDTLIKQIIKEQQDLIKNSNATVAFLKGNCLSKEDPVKLINLSMSSINSFKKFYSPKDTLFEEFFDLNHEVGHALLEHDKKSNPETAEVMADAFAALMHIRKFGEKNIDFINKKAFNHSYWVVEGIKDSNANYYTSAGIFAAEQLASKLSLETLPIEDVAWYSKKIGLHYSVSLKNLEKIRKAYIGASNNLFSSKQEVDLIVAKTMLQHKEDEEIYRAGKLFLMRGGPHLYISSPLTSLKKRITNKKTLRTFEQLSEKMDKHEKETGFILNPAEKQDDALFKDLLNRVTKKKPVCVINDPELIAMKKMASLTTFFIEWLEEEKKKRPLLKPRVVS